MNIMRKYRTSIRSSSMIVQLWKIMMLPVILTIAFMWIFQIYFMEQNYVNSNISEIQNRLEPVLEDLKKEDLAYGEQMISYLSNIVHGKMLIADQNGQLLILYSYGLPINLAESHADILVWECIANSEEYQNVLAGKPYEKGRREGARIKSYESGVPIRYYGENAYLILYRSFDELYSVLDMNRRQLIMLSILLTLAASVLAAFLAKKFARPILDIKGAVDRLAQGELTAVPGFQRGDEIGQLAYSVEELGTALQRVDMLRKEVIANVSHELRSPLALIIGYAEMVKDITWKNPVTRSENLNLIISESRRMSEMVDDIMDYSQLQSGYLQLKKGEYDLCEIVETECLRYEQIARDNHLTLLTEHPGKEYMVHVDALKISQVIRNLLNNAINHTQDGNTITVSVSEASGGYKVSVINPGEPILEEEKNIIWERYQRSQHQGGRRQGTGIGLSIVSTILNAHGIDYGVECGGGLICFWFLYKK